MLLFKGTRCADRLPRVRIIVEMGEVGFTCDLGDPWWRYFLPLYRTPVDSFKPHVTHYSLGTRLNIVLILIDFDYIHASKTLGEVRLKEALNQFSSVERYLAWEIEIAVCYFPVNLIRILVIKWRIPKDKVKVIYLSYITYPASISNSSTPSAHQSTP